MNPASHIYVILVRPPGSFTWTFHLRNRVPWRDSRPDRANREACEISEHGTYCALVKRIELPPEVDAEQYALLADGDTKFMPTKPLLISVATGEEIK